MGNGLGAFYAMFWFWKDPPWGLANTGLTGSRGQSPSTSIGGLETNYRYFKTVASDTLHVYSSVYSLRLVASFSSKSVTNFRHPHANLLGAAIGLHSEDCVADDK